MTSETEINKIIIRQLQKHNLKYNCYFDPDENGDVVSCFDWDNFPHILDEKCIFAECSDSELILLFNAVIDRQPLDWDIITEICKMLLIKGDLIEDKLKKINISCW